MEKKLVQRIIGGLVVVALVIIILPLLFHGKESQPTVQTVAEQAPPFPHAQQAMTGGINLAEKTAVEPQDALSPAAIAAPLMKVVSHEVAPAVEAAAPIADAEETPVVHQAEAKKQPAHKAGWVVQMGSFSNKANANRLTRQLVAKGYHAFTQQSKSSNRLNVLVGPGGKRGLASTLASKIKHDFDMQGIVVSFAGTAPVTVAVSHHKIVTAKAVIKPRVHNIVRAHPKAVAMMHAKVQHEVLAENDAPAIQTHREATVTKRASSAKNSHDVPQVSLQQETENPKMEVNPADPNSFDIT
jgi:DedD protein